MSSSGGAWNLSLHARNRSRQQHLTADDVAAILLGGEILEDYPEDQRGHSALLLGRASDGRSVHVVCALDEAGELIVITVYVPEPPRWVDERTRRS